MRYDFLILLKNAVSLFTNMFPSALKITTKARNICVRIKFKQSHVFINRISIQNKFTCTIQLTVQIRLTACSCLQ